ncbi:O-antigen polymerase [Methylosinus sp. C49]|uniref:O-antigen polymerase n=1 Tax=Methylosinus sp. C49 TaxID=2699395 RepID=UPI00137B5D7C|nr:O-antigen polymerase [Methylosinus sp. C49]
MYEFVLFIGVVIWVAASIFYIKRPCASLFHPATYYLIVHGIVFVIRPLFAWYYGYDTIYLVYLFFPDLQTKCTALAGADVGLIAFMASALRFGGRAMNFEKNTGSFSRKKTIYTYIAVLVVCLPFAVFSTYSIIGQKVSDIESMVRDDATGYAINTTGNGYFTDAALMLLPLLVILVWLFRFRWWSFVPFLCGVGLRAASGSRWPFVMAFFSLCLFYLFEKRQKWLTASMIVGTAAIGVLFTAIGQDRGELFRTVFGGQSSAEVDIFNLRPLESMDYANMEFFEYLVHIIPNKTGTYNYFVNNLQIFTEPVPRILWTGKPVGAPIKLYSLFDYGYPIGMTNSLPGEGWAQLGWIGIIAWCYIFGYAYGKIYNSFSSSRKSPAQVAVYCIFMPLSIGVFRDGLLLSAFKMSAFTLLPVLLWGMIMRLTRNDAGISATSVHK